MPTDELADRAEPARKAGRSAYRTAVDVILTGIVVIVPLVITIYVLQAALSFIAGALRPLIQVFEWAGLIEGVKSVGVVDLLITVGIYANVVEVLTSLIAVLILAVVIVAVGLLARFHYGERLIDYFDYLIGVIPGVGQLYRSFRQMGEVMLESGVDNFQSVKLVEFPDDDVYVLGFKTAQAAPAVMAAVDDEDMVTLFLPLAPNPVMGGFLAHVPDERAMDVDMSVEDAVQTIITSGIATDQAEGSQFRDLTDDEKQGIQGLGSGDDDT